MKYAYFDPTNGYVIQWIDTELYNYELPDKSLLRPCADEEFELQHQGEMMVISDSIIPYVEKKTPFDIWNGFAWVDGRTPGEIAAYNRSLLPVLPKRQFALYLYDHDLYDSVMTTLDQNPRFKIEYETVKDLERLSPTVSAMTALLGWSDEQVDVMWNEALKL